MRHPLRVCVAGSLAAGLFVAGCSGGSATSSSANRPADSTAATGSGKGATTVQGGAVRGAAGGAASGAAAPAPPALPPLNRPVSAARDLIRTGALSVEVADVAAAARHAADIAAAAGGLVYDERTDQPRPAGGGPAATVLTVKVAPEHFDAALDQLAALGRQQNRSISVTDVTDTVTDIQSRLAAQQASVARVQALLDQAKNLSDIVTIEAELARRQGDLDSLAARNKALTDQTALATITVTLQAPPIVLAAHRAHLGFGAGLRSGWRAFTGFLAVLLTLLGALLPFTVVLAVVVGLGWRILWPRLAAGRARSAD
jgi:hypothetical protein